ncbi:unnamed protein product [Mytilus edulis]|uniref:Uncharacterized protein n=1 Tax=Mytilus edulis TaxID=6550 RepID=A0A8S3T972_MYTED|nr:unnamed protein product [Mytilus edulis]
MNKIITRNQIIDNCSCITSNEIKTTKLFKCKCESAGTDRNVWMEFVCKHSSSKDSNLKTILLEKNKSTNEVYLNHSCISLSFYKGVSKYRIELFCRGYGLGVKCKCNVPVDNQLGHSVSSKDLTLSDNGNQESPLVSRNDRVKRDVDDVVNTTQILVETTSLTDKMTTKLMTSILSKGSTETTVRKTQTTKQGRTLPHLTTKTSQYVTTTDNQLAVTSQKAQASHQNTIITTNNHQNTIITTNNPQVLSTESEFTSETENTTKQIGATLPKSKKGGSPVAIAVGVVVPILILTIIGVVVYKWYRRKYPVRMVLGKNFSKFQNPVYNKKTSTLSLVRSVPYDAPYSGTDQDGGHDNPALDMEYRDLQPVSFSTNYENAESITEIDEVPKKPPRSKKRASVMSTESTDGRVMSAFLQEAINEADSESDSTNESNKTKKKISVDVDMRKNVSRVSVESVESENDLHTSDEESTDERTYENITISSKKGIANSVPEESYVETKSSDDEDNYEEVETVRTEKNLSDENEEYDIVNVDESETSNATQIIDQTTEQNSDNSDADYENFEMRSENNEQGISIGGIQLDEIDGNEIHSPFVEGGKKKKVKVTFEENETLESDEESIDSIDLSAVKDENVVETNNHGSGRSETNQNDIIETPKVIKISEMPLLLQPLAKSESRPVSKASANTENRPIAPTQSDVREKIAVNQNKSSVVSDDSESENDTDSHKSDDTGINQTYLHTHEGSSEPSVKSVGTSDSSEDGSMGEFENLNNMNETFGQHGSKENDNKELSSIPPLPNIPPPDIQNFQSMISSDYVITETPKDVADASSGDESASFSNKRQEQINADSLIFETTSIPPLPLSKPPPTFEQNSASSDSFEIINGTNTNASYNVFEDHSILNVDSDNKSDLSENPPTPPIPGSPPPMVQQNQPEFPYDSFTVMTKPGDIHTEDQSQTKHYGSPMADTDDEYDVLTNDDLIPVSSDPDELMPGSSYVTPANPQLVTKIEEESDVGSDVVSISDTNSEPGEYENQTDTALSSSTTNAEVEQRFSKVISSPKINFYDAETSTKVIASPKINFDDTDSDSEKSDTNSESSV